MKKADFKSAVKQKLLPNFNAQAFTSPSLNLPGPPTLQGSGQVIPPRPGLAGKNGAERLPMSQTNQTGTKLTIDDILTDYWFSALQPVQPMAPTSYRPRQWAYTIGANYIWTPGDDKGGITFENLRTLADGFDLLRIIIETRKDQIARIPWQIRVKRLAGELVTEGKKRQAEDPIVQQLTKLFAFPDGIRPWRTWIRMLMEDMLVLDAIAVYLQRDNSGRIASLLPIDGATINRLITDQGLTPTPPDPAYQQVVYGIPAANLTTDDLLYVMRNERTFRKYGYSPVEQILVTIGIGLRREDFQLQYYTSGSVPDALVFLPADIPVQKLRQVQEWFDSVMSGDLQKRRRLTFLPGYGTGDNARPNVVFPKEPLLKDPMDEWLIGIICYAFSVSPQAFQKMINRATAETQQNMSQEEGLEPALLTVADLCNQIIDKMGLGEKYEFAWQEEPESDPVKQAAIDAQLVGKIYTINEIREQRGEDPRPEPEADMLGIFGPTGFIPLDSMQSAEIQTNVQNYMAENGPQPEEQPQGGSTQQAAPAGSLKKASNPRIGQPRWENEAPSVQVRRFVKVERLTNGHFLGKSYDQYKNEVYGSLAEYPTFAAYDSKKNTIYLKGEIDVDEALQKLSRIYPELNGMGPRMVLTSEEK